jgi:hypothetical protein
MWIIATSQAAAINIFGINAGASPIYLVLGVLLVGYGIWMVVKDRKKPKAKREAERDRYNDRFLNNINRNDSIMRGDDDPKPTVQLKPKKK